MGHDLFCQISSNFVESLKELIDESGKSIKELAKDIEIGESTLYLYLKKENFPKLSTLLKLTDYFQCTMDFLLGEKEQNTVTRFLPCPPFSKRFPLLLKEWGKSKYYITNLYYWQTGEKVPTAEHLVLLSREFHCSIDYILGREC